MAKYIVTHGTIISGKELIGLGGSVEMSPEDKGHIDPDGNKLATPEVYEQMQRASVALKAVEEAKAKPAPKAEAKPSSPAPTPKGGTK
jgi:hypothetical protein